MLEMECVFTNATAVAQRFLYCTMLGLKDKAGTTRLAPATSPKWILEAVGDTYKCKESGTVTPQQSGWHFACKEVSVPAGVGAKSAPVVLKSTTSISGDGIYRPPAGARITALKADDFWVNYADTVKFNATVTKFDPASCVDATGGSDGKHKDLNGQDTYLVPRGAGAAAWIQQKKEFRDPVVRYQPLVPAVGRDPCDYNGDGEVDTADIKAIFAARNRVVLPGSPGDADRDGRITVNDAVRCARKVSKVYSLYDDLPCVPPAFPATVPGLRICPLSTATSPPPLSMDLNLYDFDTMDASLGIDFPSILRLSTRGSTAGLRVETEPAANSVFTIPGGRSDFFGRIRVCDGADTSRCRAVSGFAEGRTLGTNVDVFDAASSEFRFYQYGRFVFDSDPPQIESSSVQFDGAGLLNAQLSAFDAASSPVHANLWFSTDGGASWTTLTMEPGITVLDEPHLQAFAGTVGPFPPGTTLHYFFDVQDVVSNVVYLGVGQLTR